MSGLSLFTIEESLAMLVEAREAAEAEGDAETVAECDKALAQYLTAEAAKVNSYAALIRRQLTEAEECEAEAQRLAARAKTRRAFVDRLKATALEVMQRFGVKELRSATNTLRVQKNGGAQPLEIQNALIPAEYIRIIVRVPENMVQRLMKAVRVDKEMADSLEVQLKPTETASGAIRKALAQRVLCPECCGKRYVNPDGSAINAFVGSDEDPVKNCPCCGGQGTLPVTIPGARLLDRGSHVRVE